MGKSIPEGWHTVTPRLIVRDVDREVQFLKEAFNATGDLQPDMPCQMRIGDSVIMVSGVGVRELMPAFLYLYVDDADATYERAIKAGAESLEDPLDMPYGDRRAMVRDPGGNTWQIATHNKEAFDAFMRQRMAAGKN
jgi:PhnB protein